MQTKAPLRISFSGGGSDIEPYCSEYGGVVLSATIDMYAYAEYPSAFHQPTELEQTIAWRFDKPANQLRVETEVPPRGGLGGSASCFVAGLKAVKPDLETKELAELAFELERNVMGEAGGKQDQYMAVYGGANFLTFNTRGTKVEPLPMPHELEELLLLVYMGKRNYSGADIILDQMSRAHTEPFRIQKEIAWEMKRCLFGEMTTRRLEQFGILLDQAWQSKRKFSPFVSNNTIDKFNENCKQNGAIGGKLTGAGGGGYMLLMEHPTMKGRLRDYLKSQHVVYRQVKFESEGVRCVKNN